MLLGWREDFRQKFNKNFELNNDKLFEDKLHMESLSVFHCGRISKRLS